MSLNVLIVDDEPLARGILESYFQKISGFTVVSSCQNALEAFSILSKQKIDIVLLDINMPIMNGWEFLDEYKRLNLDPLGKSKIYIISSSVFNNDINKAKSYPLVKDFVSKPLSVDKIKDLLGLLSPN